MLNSNRETKSVYDRTEVSIEEYFDIQLKHQDIEYPKYDEEDPDSYEIIYVGYASSKPEFYKQYEVDNNKTIEDSTYEELKILQEELRVMEPKLLKLMQYLDRNKYTHEVAYIKELRILLYSLYFSEELSYSGNNQRALILIKSITFARREHNNNVIKLLVLLNLISIVFLNKNKSKSYLH